MLWGGNIGALEIRAEGGETHLSAVFPYGSETELAPGRREVFAPHAFRARVEAGEEIHLLTQHDYSKPLASTAAGNLTLRDLDEGLELRATVDASTSWAADFIAAHKAGLVRGISPGFRVERGGDRVERRGAEIVRTVHSASLFEISAVTRAAYPQAQIEARAWESHQDRQPVRGAVYPLNRWRL
ncbi:HK97 family phage prohead protease [Celeribacter halophilus]|uniref:HK97 family phage prohead protease n=1 Tax=Celeribacter halophilus TaxID=576117 RepID=UPI002FD5D74A